jgi:hypothetical protein
MPTEQQFREKYSALATALRVDAVGSPEYQRLLQEWMQSGSPNDIKEFLFRSAKTSPELPEIRD